LTPNRRTRLPATRTPGYAGGRTCSASAATSSLTKARRYSVTFAFLRAARVDYRRATDTGPEASIRTAEHADAETTLIVGTLSFAGIGWHNSGDAILANTSAAMARARAEAARDALTDEHITWAAPTGLAA
jgi:hypothetical protein